MSKQNDLEFKTIQDFLVKFLMDSECYAKFVYNLHRAKPPYVRRTVTELIDFEYKGDKQYRYLITSAFDWNDTPERCNFWLNVAKNFTEEFSKSFGDSDNIIIKPTKLVFNSIW